MNLRDFRIGWRRLLADPGYSAVVVLGLALAFATVAVLLAYFDVALRGDADVPDARRVVRLESITHLPGAERNWIPDSTMMFHEQWSTAGAPVAVATRYFAREMSVRLGSQLVPQTISFVDYGVSEVFGLQVIAGDATDALKRPDAAVLSEKTAARLFPTSTPLGQTVQVAGRPLTVRAIVRDRPKGSVIATEFLVNIRSPVMPGQSGLQSWLSIQGTNYVRLLPAATPEQFAERAQAHFEQTPAYREIAPAYGKIVTFRAVALPDLPLAGAGSERTRRLLAALSASCLLVTLLAAVNYLNLGTVRAMARQREIGIRKALGASPMRIAAQFFAEAVLVAVVACAIGIVLAWIAAPILAEWVDRPLASVLLSPGKVALALALSVALGFIVGAYPAWVALRVDCAQSLAGREQAETTTALWFRRALTVLQFGAAMALVGMTVVVLWQTHHVAHADPGYDPGPLLVIDAPVDMRDDRLPAIRDAISHLPGVRAVGLAWDVPGRFRRYTTTNIVTPDGRSLLLAFNWVGPGFFQAYGIAPLAGRVFDPERDKQGNRNVMVVNARAVRQLGFADAAAAVGQKVRMGPDSVEIIGVIPDIRQRSLRDMTEGVLYAINEARGVSVLSIRSDDVARTRHDIEPIWAARFPDNLLRIESVQAQLERLYDGDLRLGKVIGAGGIIALALAGFGLYALSAYTVRRRTPEIVIRKLHGAGPRDIAWILIREFATVIAIGALLGLPVARWLAESYLSGYVDRAPIGLWALAIAFACIALIALAAAVRHTLRAMVLSPLRALRAAA